MNILRHLKFPCADAVTRVRQTTTTTRDLGASEQTNESVDPITLHNARCSRYKPDTGVAWLWCKVFGGPITVALASTNKYRTKLFCVRLRLCHRCEIACAAQLCPLSHLATWLGQIKLPLHYISLYHVVGSTGTWII